MGGFTNALGSEAIARSFPWPRHHRTTFQLEDLRIETEHEVADEGLVAFHAVVLAEAASAIALKLEVLRIETEHEADQGLVTFHAVVLAEATGAIALKLESLRVETEHEADEGLVAIHAVVLAEAAGAIALKHKDCAEQPQLLQPISRFSQTIGQQLKREQKNSKTM